jgi:hypothetical protein
VDEAIEAGERLLALYDELGCGMTSYSRTCYDMFQIAVMKKSTLPRAKHFITEAIKYQKIMYNGLEGSFGHLPRYKGYAKNPKTHRNYLASQLVEHDQCGIQ